MSVQAISWALKQRIRPAYKLTLIALCNYADANGESAFPKQQTLADDTGYSRITINKHLQWLSEHDLITLVEKRRREDGRQSTNLYRVNLDYSGHSQSKLDAIQSKPDTTSRVNPGFTAEPSYEPSVNRQIEGRASDDAPAPKSLEEKAVENWNHIAEKLNLKTVRVLNTSRRNKLKARLKEVRGLPGWNDALRNIGQSSFLLGKNDRGWQIDFDFMLKPDRLAKLLEGGYANGEEE